MSHKKPRPNVFIIGKHKAGTSALSSLLVQHPDVYVPQPIGLEMHHLESDLQAQRLTACRIVSSHIRKKFNVTMEDYLRHYEGAGSYAARVDRTPSYLLSVTAASEILEFEPRAKLIAIFREPVSFLSSLHSQNLFNLYEDQEDFLTAIRLSERRTRGEQLPSSGRHVPYMLDYYEQVRYAKQLARFMALFPTTQIKVLIYEDFRRRNIEVAKEVFEFIGVDPSVTPTFSVANPNKIRRAGSLKRLTRMVAATGIPEKVMPAGAYRTIAERYREWSTVYAPRDPLPESVVSELRKERVEEVREFVALLRAHGFAGAEKIGPLWGYDV